MDGRETLVVLIRTRLNRCGYDVHGLDWKEAGGLGSWFHDAITVVRRVVSIEMECVI